MGEKAEAGTGAETFIKIRGVSKKFEDKTAIDVAVFGTDHAQ